VLSADKIGTDINVVNEAEFLASPNAFSLCRIRIKAFKAHEAAEDRQPGMFGKVPERIIQPGCITGNCVIVLDQADNVGPGKPDRSVEYADFVQIVREDQEIVRLI
jgi:hypothetical protein